jgi:hypothetical protein
LALKGDDPPMVVIGELKLTFNLELVLQGSIGLPLVMKSGWPLAARPAVKAVKTTQGFATSVEGSALGCSECHRTAKSRFCLHRTRRPRARMPVADPVSSKSTGAGGAILPKAEDREPRS